MASLIQRINKLEKATTGMLTPDLWEEAKIIRALMDKATCPPNPALKEEALKRIIENLKDTDPDNPGMPPGNILMLAGLLKLDLEPYAVNESHRELIHTMYTSV
jgi:hypothetical protein